MKITKAEVKEGFEPFAFKVTVQTQQEQQVLDDLCVYNVTIPNLLPEGPERTIVFEFLKLLRAAVRT